MRLHPFDPIRATAVALGLALALSAWSPAAAAQRLQWQDDWPRFAWWEAVGAVAATGVFAYAQWGTKAGKPRWEGPILFDAPFRDLLVLETRSGQQAANTASDVFWGMTWAFPAVDTLVVSLAMDRNLDVTWQMAAIDAEVYALTSMLTRLMHRLSRRDRPLKLACAQDKDYDPACGDSPVSFFSGHTALAAASAGLTCVHHQYLPLYGGGWPDHLACAGAATTAALTGLMRILSDRHYTTDVLAGYAVGFLTGYFLPRLLHYRSPPRWKRAARRGQTRGYTATVMPLASEEQLGLAITGLF
jgi:membrane-associated phospholipid phosphatase